MVSVLIVNTVDSLKCYLEYNPGLFRPTLKNLGFLKKSKKLEKLNVEVFLDFLIFKPEFLLFHVKLCKFIYLIEVSIIL